MAFFKNGSVSLYYEDRGTGDTLVFLHGLGSSTLDWEDQLRFFETHFRVIALDVRGHGRSDKPIEEYSISGFSKDVWALLDHIGIDHFNLIGLSMGGMISFQMATDQPERVRGMVVINSAPEFLSRNVTVKQFIRQRKMLIRVFGFRYFCRLMAQRLFPDPDQEELRARFLVRWMSNDKKAYKLAFNALIDWSVKSKLHKIDCPVLVLGAEMDYTSHEFKQEFCRLLSHAEYQIIPGSRHMSTLDKPDVVNNMIAEFLSVHTSKASVV